MNSSVINNYERTFIESILESVAEGHVSKEEMNATLRAAVAATTYLACAWAQADVLNGLIEAMPLTEVGKHALMTPASWGRPFATYECGPRRAAQKALRLLELVDPKTAIEVLRIF